MLLEDLSLGFLVQKPSEVSANIDQSFTADTEPIANLSGRSTSWCSPSESMDDISPKLDMILSSDDEGDECEIWYADTPSTCGDGGHGVGFNVEASRQKRFFFDDFQVQAESSKMEITTSGFGLPWLQFSQPNQKRQAVGVGRSVSPYEDEDMLVEA